MMSVSESASQYREFDIIQSRWSLEVLKQNRFCVEYSADEIAGKVESIAHILYGSSDSLTTPSLPYGEWTEASPPELAQAIDAIAFQEINRQNKRIVACSNDEYLLELNECIKRCSNLTFNLGVHSAVILEYNKTQRLYKIPNVSACPTHNRVIDIIRSYIRELTTVAESIVEELVPINLEEAEQILVEKQSSHVREMVDIFESNAPIEGVKTKAEEKVKFSPQALDQFLTAINRSASTFVYQNQYRKFLQRLEEELGRDYTTVWEVRGLIPSKTRNPVMNLSDSLIESLVKRAKNYFNNKRVLADLMGSLNSEFRDGSIVDKMLEKLDMNDFLMGYRLLTPEMKDDLLLLARRMYAKEAYEGLLERIQDAAKRDLPLDEQYVEKQFHINEILTPSTPQVQKEKRQQLQVLINSAYLMRELRQRGKYVTPVAHEVKLLCSLGYQLTDSSEYYNKEEIFALMQRVIERKLVGDAFKGSTSELKRNMKDFALQARLETLGIISPVMIEKFKEGLKALEVLHTRVTFAFKGTKVTLSPDFPENALLAEKAINYGFARKKSEKFDAMLANCVSQIKTQFVDVAIDPIQFGKNLLAKINGVFPEGTTRSSEFIRRMVLEMQNTFYIKKEIAFYSRWGMYLRAEMIQGFEDNSEDLGEGVCLGGSCNAQMYAQKKPDMKPEAFAMRVKITGADRFRQAVYMSKINFRISYDSALPAEVLRKNGFTSDEILFEMAYDNNEEDFDKRVLANSPSFDKAHGWVRLQLRMVDGSHAILMRLDSVKKRAWFYDLNVGFLCFEQRGEPFETSRKRCLTFFKSLITYAYSATYRVAARILKE